MFLFRTTQSSHHFPEKYVKLELYYIVFKKKKYKILYLKTTKQGLESSTQNDEYLKIKEKCMTIDDARKLRRVREGPTSSPFLVEQISSEHAA